MNTSIIQSTIDAIDKPVIFIDCNYTIQAVNELYRELYATPVVIGSSQCHQISHNSAVPCDKNGESCPLQQCQSTGKSSSAVHIHHSDQGKQFCDILMKPVKDQDGITVGFLEILENIHFASPEMQENSLVGDSDCFRGMLKQINRAAKSDISVLLQGNTGTGKELAAKALHDGSRRSDAPFVVIECTGLSETLFESELFGHEKGAFTGAVHTKKGLIEIASGGTVFFDEIGDVPMNMQVKLLRLLETRTYRAVGGLKQKKTDFRFLSATHKNLPELIQQGKFREDLYYRIAGFPIQLPNLKSRKQDIALLVKYFVRHSEHKQKTFSPETLAALEGYAFPGNIRELKNIVEQALLLSDDDLVEPVDLPGYIVASSSQVNAPAHAAIDTQIVSLEEAEKRYLCSVFNGQQESIEVVAAQLGISVRTLYRKLKKHGISFP